MMRQYKLYPDMSQCYAHLLEGILRRSAMDAVYTFLDVYVTLIGIFSLKKVKLLNLNYHQLS